MPSKNIIFFGKPTTVSCDGKCNKAWGINKRKRVQISEHDDDFAFFADDELDIAPDDPGTYEGGHGKDPLSLNKWCTRECERSYLTGYQQPDLTKRLYNIPSSNPANNV